MTEQAEIDLEVKQGATFRQIYVWKEAGVPQSLLGYVARLQIRSRKSVTSTELLTLTSDPDADDRNPSAYITLEPELTPETLTLLGLEDSTGVYEIYMGATQTGLLTRKAAYDLELHLLGDADEVVPLMGGDVLVDKQVTE